MDTPALTVASPSRPARAMLPGDLAMWIFILAELTVFGLLLVAFAFARSSHLALFIAGQTHIDRVAGAVNTLLLLTGSWCVVCGIEAIRRDDSRGLARWFAAAIGSGLGFAVFKSWGFAQAFAAGISLSGDLFSMFYLLLTGFHFAHVLLGLVILSAIALKARRDGYSAAEHAGAESGAAYWHMVDLVWLVLFPLVYLLK